MASALHSSSAKKIYILGRRLEVLSTAAESLDKSKQVVIPIQCDVTDATSIAEAVKQVEKNVGYVDVLINNAGVTGPLHQKANTAASIEELQENMLSNWSGWEPTFAINTASVIGVSGAFLKLLDNGNSRRGFETGKMSHGEKARERKTVEGIDQNDLRSSQIITVASIAAFNRFVTAGLAYSASKAGAVALGKTLASLLAPWGIRSNVICPGSECRPCQR
jgi:NAD(P)-dependent dehydrogenase (short-subunit alcohol dehydrogenase family)